MNKIAKAYNIGDKTHQIDKKNINIYKIKYFEVIKSFQKLWLYKKQ